MAQQITENDLAEVRTITVFNSDFEVYGTVESPRFLALQVAEKIEYSPDKIGQMLENVDDDEKLTDTIYRGGQQREMWFLTENGLYELLMQSRKPIAKEFKRNVKIALRHLRMGELVTQTVAIADNTVIIEGTKFIFDTNFSGDPKRDHFGSDERKANLIIPNEDQALDLRARGFNVKETKPRADDEGDFIPTYFVVVKLNYGSQWPPKIFLVNDAQRGVLLDQESVCCVDDMWIDRVNAVLNTYNGPNGKSLYVKSMEIFQKVDDDPIASKYRN